MDKKRPDIKFWISLAAFSMGLIFFSVTKPELSGKDDSQYDILAWNLVSGNGYSLDASPPYRPSNLREPGYVFFLFLVYRFLGHNIKAVYFIQMFLFSITCILIFLIAREAFNIQVAKYSAFLTSFCPTLANYTILLYSEIFFIFILVCTIFSLINAKNSNSTIWFLFSGILSGLLVLCKAIMLFFTIPLGLYLYLNRKDLKKIILFFLISLLIIMPWFLRNYHTFRTFNLANRGEMNLLIRANKVDYSFQKIKASIIYSISEYLGYKFFPDTSITSRDFLLMEDYRVYDRHKELLEEGKSEREIGQILKKEALIKIKAHPLKYLIQTPIEFFKLTTFMHLPLLYEKNIVDGFRKLPNGLIILSALRGIYKLSSFFILLLVLIGIFGRREHLRRCLIVILLILYINIIYSLLNGFSRYSLPLIPFYLMFATVGLRHLLRSDYA